MASDNKPTQKILSKPMIFMIIGLVIVFGAIFGWGFIRGLFMKQFFAHFTPPPATISTIKARAEVWQPNLTAPGTLVAINGVQVSSEVSGMVVKILFDSGQRVKAGQPLVQLDTDDDLQDLKNYEAQLRLAKISYERQSKLYKTGSAAAAALDEARATLQQTEALTGKTRVMIEKKTIRAPFDGKIGIRQVNLGQYLNAGTSIASLQALDPLYAQFSLPEQDLRFLTLGQSVQAQVESQGTATFPGKITAINSEVNNTTRNILIQATIPNPQNLLYPGMYAQVQVQLPQQNEIITLPQTAITYNLYGDTVFVVKPDGKKDKAGNPVLRAHLTYVTTGERRGNEVAILKGLQVGDEVVTSGQLKLQDGTAVTINNSVDVNTSTRATSQH